MRKRIALKTYVTNKENWARIQHVKNQPTKIPVFSNEKANDVLQKSKNQLINIDWPFGFKLFTIYYANSRYRIKSFFIHDERNKFEKEF